MFAARTRILIVGAAFALAAAASAAQRPLTAEEAETLWTAPRFFAAIVAGVVLAVAFQLLLTMLSVATGVSAIGPLDEHADRGRGSDPETRRPERARRSSFGRPGSEHVAEPPFAGNPPPGASTRPGDKSDRDKDHGVGATLRRLNHAYGAWALVTGAVSLFFASWLAVELALTVDALNGAVLGLVIWGLFLLTATLLETRAMSSLAGGLLHLAGEGLRATARSAGSLFGRSEKHQLADQAAEITAAVRDEIFGDERVDDLKEEVRSWVARLEPKLDPAAMRRELEKLLDHAELRALVNHEMTDEGVEDLVSASLKMRRGASPETVKKASRSLVGAISTIKQEAKSGKSRGASAADAAMRVAGMSEEEAHEMRSKLAEHLRRTGREELDPDGIERDLTRLFTRPKEGLQALRERVSRIDRETVRAALTARGDLSSEQAERIVSRVESVLAKLSRKKADGGSIDVEPFRRGDGPEGGWPPEGGTAEAPGMEGALDRALSKVRRYLNDLDRPELRYESIRQDFALLKRNPRAGGEALLGRLKSMDRETVKAIVASTREDLTEEEIEDLIQRVESSRDRMVERIEHMRDEVEHRIEDLQREALDKAESGRQIAVSAAWWTAGSATVWGAAAALGGLVAVWTGVG